MLNNMRLRVDFHHDYEVEESDGMLKMDLILKKF